MKKYLLAASLLPLLLCTGPSFTQAPAEPAQPDIDIYGPAMRVANIDRSLKFYIDGLGLKLLLRLQEGKGEAALLVPQGRTMPPMIDLLQDDPANPQPIVLGNGFSRTVLSVANSAEVWARLKAAGYAPSGNGKGGIFFVKDPDGYSLEITQRGMGIPKPK